MAAFVRVRRVGLPRYDIEYASLSLALDHARLIRKTQVLKLASPIVEPLGAEIVCDLMAEDVPIGTTLLFRIVRSSAAEVVLEWWPRRQTDPALLDLWIECLAARTELLAHTARLAPGAEEQHELLDLCRSTMAHNPFIVLGVHWAAEAADVEQAALALDHKLTTYRAGAGLSVRGAELTDAALARVADSRAQLATLAGRQAARARFVPRDEVQRAREHAARKVEICLLSGDREKVASARSELQELTFSTEGR